MSQTKNHALIIGAGVAGLTNAIHLIRAGWQVTLVDNNINFSSRVAAGMINPIVFRRMTKSWRADEFIPYLQSFYTSVEVACEKPLYHPIVIRRMFSTEQERELWIKKQDTDDFKDYMSPATQEDDNYDRVINNCGSGRVLNAGYVDTDVFLNEGKKIIQAAGNVLNEEFEYDKLDGLNYKGTTYSDVIFCEGYLGKNNPWFGSLPLNQTKGETLNIRSKKIPEDESVNRKCFILPLGNHEFKVGSTYSWHDSDTSITKLGREQILDKMSYLVDDAFEVVEQAAGVRPTTIDRRPLIGTHPNFPNYHVFNGLGTKGYLICPLLSKEFVDYLTLGNPLNSEVDIQRVYPGR